LSFYHFGRTKPKYPINSTPFRDTNSKSEPIVQERLQVGFWRNETQ
jgi:hypothetical protein